MYAERILNFGYPKLHDAKNYTWRMISGDVGVWKKYDLYTANMWGQYYFAVPSAYLARQTGDLFLKTAIFRIPFALTGMIGVLILPFSILFLFGKERNKKIVFFASYIFLQLFSISLILHLREVRSYSLAVLFCSFIMILFTRMYFDNFLSKGKYILIATISFILLFNIFPPAYMVMVVALGSYPIIDFFKSRRQKGLDFKNVVQPFFRRSLYLLLPILLSLITALPILVIFGVSETSMHAYQDMYYGLPRYLSQLWRVLSFLTLHNFLILIMVQKTVLIILFAKVIKKVKIGEEDLSRLTKKISVSNLFSYTSLVYILLIPLTPYLFDRYFIFLQPFTLLIFLLDFFIVLEAISNIYVSNEKINYITGYLSLVLFFFVVSIVPKIDSLNGHLYELSHRYTGPLDEIITYIKANITHPEDLFIETNLEQTSYIYYLDSQVFCDEVTECKKPLPDIIIPRRYMLGKDFIDRMEKNMQMVHYDKVLLPILDYPSNNIPEFSFSLRHLYKAPYTNNDSEKVVMFIKFGVLDKNNKSQ